MTIKHIRIQLTQLVADNPKDIYYQAQEIIRSNHKVEHYSEALAAEWEKLHIAKNREMMDDEQIHLAVRAYLRRLSNTITDEVSQEEAQEEA